MVGDLMRSVRFPPALNAPGRLLLVARARCRARLAGEFGIVRRKVARGAPRYAFRFIARPPFGKILGERAKISGAARHRDHGALIQAPNHFEDISYCALERRSVRQIRAIRRDGESTEASRNLSERANERVTQLRASDTRGASER